VDVIPDDNLIERLKHVGCAVNVIFVHIIILMVHTTFWLGGLKGGDH
jgi:hypothetical protein